MKRDINQHLIYWKDSSSRRPLVLRGARQVGKSYALAEFAKTNFENFLVVNFDRTPEAKKFFDRNLDPKRILSDLGVYYNIDVAPGKSVIIFDEIQECPGAITALRYFQEEMPQLHVLGAGSLLEFVLRSEDFKMPVGRIEYLWMKPLSFGEFLDATGRDKMRERIRNLTVDAPLEEPLHNELLKIFKEYACVGGMPAIVDIFEKNRALRQVKELKESLLQTFRDDFGKYASRAHYQYLSKVFLIGSKMVGRKFKYSHIEPSFQIRDIKNALELLIHAGLFYKIKHTSGVGLPLEADTNEKKFKVIFFDVGLMERLVGWEDEVYFSEDLNLVHQGSVAEQLVGQELLAYASPKIESKLYFWTREAKSSSAEVDYLVVVGDKICPIEVKSAAGGRLKSLRLFMKERSCKVGVRISGQPLSFHDGILSIPIYAIERLEALIVSCFI